ncbi:hypothetical protein EWM60_14030 [Candidatus Erwinia dacicola]|nr:hypothetical protein [Candidatus Erwinia dacicola]
MAQPRNEDLEKEEKGSVKIRARPVSPRQNNGEFAYVGMVRMKGGTHAELSITVRPRWPLAELPAI